MTAPKPLHSPTLETERLILHAATPEHAEAYEAEFNDYEVIRQLSAAVPWPYPAGGVRAYIEGLIPKLGEDRWFWVLAAREHPGKVIGAIELWREGVPGHRGFWLGRRFWGRGYMSEACCAVTDLAFDELGFDELIFSNAVGNVRSRRVKERAGAELIGTRPARFVDPVYTEAETWRLTRKAHLDSPRSGEPRI